MGHLCAVADSARASVEKLYFTVHCADPYDSGGEPVRPRVNSDSRKGDMTRQRSGECVLIHVCMLGWVPVHRNVEVNENGDVSACMCFTSLVVKHCEFKLSFPLPFS